MTDEFATMWPNEATALDAAMTLLFHIVAHRRRASELIRSVSEPADETTALLR